MRCLLPLGVLATVFSSATALPAQGPARATTPAEAAELACYLVSSLNSYMNGEVVVMDGGL